ncbi:MAG: thiamine pyrophosphate-binding protein [Chloroflexota bacterium]
MIPQLDSYQQAVVVGLEAARIDYFLHVPGGPLAPIIAHFRQSETVVELPLAREEEGIGVMAGLVLGKKRPILIMQDNGLGNSVGVLNTLAKAYHLPGLILSARRGGLTEFNSAMHYFTEHVPDVLAALDVKTFTLHQALSPEAWAAQIPLAYEHSLITHRPVVVLLELD